jgi:hypothetical protein
LRLPNVEGVSLEVVCEHSEVSESRIGSFHVDYGSGGYLAHMDGRGACSMLSHEALKNCGGFSH